MKFGRSVKWSLILALLLLCVGSYLQAEAPARLKLSSTTSLESTGFLEYIAKSFKEKYQAELDVIAVGTGKALKLAENGDVDLTFVHEPELEKKFVAAGFGVDRTEVMSNYFVLVGPEKDPAGIANAPDIGAAFKKIVAAKALFVSRGDQSGTHLKELAIWKAIGRKVRDDKKSYISVGKGMGETLMMADEKMGYTLTDRGTYLKYRTKIALKILFAKTDPQLYNVYSIIAVNTKKHPKAQYTLAKEFIDFVASAEGQELIANFKDPDGQPFFQPIKAAKP
jgi:tungstate transport system substrate-binding protein